jgi:hypothetical protein
MKASRAAALQARSAEQTAALATKNTTQLDRIEAKLDQLLASGVTVDLSTVTATVDLAGIKQAVEAGITAALTAAQPGQ